MMKAAEKSEESLQACLNSLRGDDFCVIGSYRPKEGTQKTLRSVVQTYLDTLISLVVGLPSRNYWLQACQ